MTGKKCAQKVAELRETQESSQTNDVLGTSYPSNAAHSMLPCLYWHDWRVAKLIVPCLSRRDAETRMHIYILGAGGMHWFRRYRSKHLGAGYLLLALLWISAKINPYFFPSPCWFSPLHYQLAGKGVTRFKPCGGVRIIRCILQVWFNRHTRMTLERTLLGRQSKEIQTCRAYANVTGWEIVLEPGWTTTLAWFWLIWLKIWYQKKAITSFYF